MNDTVRSISIPDITNDFNCFLYRKHTGKILEHTKYKLMLLRILLINMREY